jgi:hypothetical protein
MVETRYFNNGKARIRYHALSQIEIERMTAEQLRERVIYIDRQLTLWNQPTSNLTDWIKQAAQTWRNALNTERRRVNREIERRQTVHVEAEWSEAGIG